MIVLFVDCSTLPLQILDVEYRTMIVTILGCDITTDVELKKLPSWELSHIPSQKHF